MQIDIAFEFAKVYNIERADVVMGQKFTLLSDFDNGKWFSDNDPVLSLIVNGRDAEVSANEKGATTILIMDSALAIQKILTINVVEAIAAPAVTLGVSAGSPIPK